MHRLAFRRCCSCVLLDCSDWRGLGLNLSWVIGTKRESTQREN
jgi:hypothetical protein